MHFFARIVIAAMVIKLVAPKQINITVMVPGIKAFRNLYTIVHQLNSSLEYYDVTTDIAEGSEQLWDPYAYARKHCVDRGVVSVGCVHYVQSFRTYPWSYVFAKPALEIALETIKRSEGLLDGFEIALRYYDSGNKQGRASAKLAQIAAVDSMMKDHMTAMIGPMNAISMSSVASFTTHWGKLNLTPDSISVVLRDTMLAENNKNVLVRSGPEAGQVGDCVLAILRFYNWTSAGAQVFDDDPIERYHFFMAEGIFNSIFTNYPKHRISQIRLSEYNMAPGGGLVKYNYDVIFKEIKEQGRVLIICAGGDVVSDLMAHAREQGHNGEFVYIIIDLNDNLGPTPWVYEDDNGTKVADEALRKIFETAVIVTLPKERTRRYDNFVYKLKQKLGSDLYDDLDPGVSRHLASELALFEGLKYGAENLDEYFQKNQHPAYLHDSLLMLAHVFNSSLNGNNESISYGEDHHLLLDPWSASSNGKYSPTFPDGSYLMKKFIANKEFEGVSGKMAFDNKGDRRFEFIINRLGVDAVRFREIGTYDAADGIYHEHTVLRWPGGGPPPDTPKCGFSGRKCPKNGLGKVEIAAISIVAFACFLGATFFNIYRPYKLRKELESQLWRVNWSDITWSGTPNSILSGTTNWSGALERARASESDPSLGEVMSYFVPSLSPALSAKRALKRKRKWSSNSRKNERVFDNERKTSAGSLISDGAWGGLTAIGLYKDKTVVLKMTTRRKVELTRSVLMELKHMRDVTHEHLTRFEGACVEWPNICILTEYCGKGSLKDILLNEEITMDWMFRVSLMNDLVKGMCFLHESSINCHGNLKSTNCVVDSRFVLKITDYGLNSFRNPPSAEESERDCEKKLWTAPELLRCSSNTFTGTQKGDVYSFGIILQEIALRKGPFYVGGIPLSCKEIISKVRCGFPPYFRPMVDLSILSEDICNLMQNCWNEDPNERPDFTLTKRIIVRFNRENPGNLVENLLHRMEQYAINLEGLVEEKTAAYIEEKQKADDLLYQMLPVPVVDRLKRGDAVPAEAFESVTICFTDIVGFTSLSAASSPMQIVSLLNDLYTCFDAIIDNFDVYKVETIGDAYMLVSGLPVRNGIRHAREIARTALALLRAVSNFKIRHRPGDQLKLRIGIHTGPCCAGVVGLKMPRYCLFGDTVNTASRMESSGSPLAIHVSESTKELLDKYQSFQLQLRGDVPMKGKGALTTYWLVSEITDDVKSFPEKESHI